MEERLLDVVAAAHAVVDPYEVARMVRDAMVDIAGFDRCGVWLIQHGLLLGSWGTDADGGVRDERSLSFSLEHFVGPSGPLLTGRARTMLFEGTVEAYAVDCEHPDDRVFLHGAASLRARGSTVGIIYVDNLPSGRPVVQAVLNEYLDFIDAMSLALSNAMARADLEKMVALRDRWIELSAAISSSLDLDSILRMARDAIATAGGFDRVGVLRVEKDTIHGSWGTDDAGNPRPEQQISLPVSEWPVSLEPLLTGRERYLIAEWSPLPLFDTGVDRPIQHAVVGLQTGGELVGLICVDNQLTDRPIVDTSLNSLLSFATLIAVAIRNARLFDELSQTQQALMAAERLRAVGEMAGGIAHNLNNILTAVLGFAQLIHQNADAPPGIARQAKTIERAALDGAEIVRRMQQFSRREVAAPPAIVDLARIVRDAVEITRPAWSDLAAARGAKIEIADTLPAELPAIGIDGELREVFAHILTNAVDAMPGGGTIRVTGGGRSSGVEIDVCDTGVGMDEETRRHVFEPFFTTKPTVGTGLGLSVAWGIVARLGGEIDVQSTPGVGSTFTVRLKPVPEPPSSEPPVPAAAALRGMRVLLVDDDKLVGESVACMLRSAGARVSVASDAEMALQWLDEHAAECRVVVSDHGMPGMTGAQLLAHLRTAYPEIHRVLLSGWGDLPPDGVDLSAAELVMGKPIRPEALASALRQLR